jgi:hypothetical protein
MFAFDNYSKRGGNMIKKIALVMCVLLVGSTAWAVKHWPTHEWLFSGLGSGRTPKGDMYVGFGNITVKYAGTSHITIEQRNAAGEKLGVILDQKGPVDVISKTYYVRDDKQVSFRVYVEDDKKWYIYWYQEVKPRK